MAGPIDILNALLGKSSGAAETANIPPIMQTLQDAGLLPPPQDKGTILRNQLAEGLAGLSKGIMAHPEYDFGAALASGLGEAATGVINASNDSDKLSRERAQQLMTQIFGLAKAEDMSGYRDDNLAIRKLLGEGRLEQGERRLDQGQQRLDETGRHNLVTEGQGSLRIEQGDDRIGQGQQRIDETGRHNLVTEEQGGARVDETTRHNQATEAENRKKNEATEKDRAARQKFQNEKLQFQRDKAKADAEAAKSRSEKSALDKDNTRSAIFARIEGLKSQKAKDLGLNDSTKKLIDPEGYAAAQEEYRAYSDEIDKQFKGAGQTSSGAPQTEGPQPVPPPREAGTQPQVTKWTEKNPAYPKSKAEYDALPPGSVFFNPKTKTLKRKPANGGQVPPQ